ncbi:MAG: glycosyltransferase family 4 protein [Chloroflexi bacterium]|nr:glycosyltransferase family 4 protein [Chloroflexota bacterium]
MSEKLRVLVVTNTYPTADRPGDTPQVHDQVEALRAKGCDIDLMYVNRYEGRRSYARAAWAMLLLSLRSQRYDLVHAYYGHCGLLARLQFRYPIVVTFLGSDLLHPRDGAIGKVVAKVVDGVIVQSEEMKRAARRGDAYVIPMGVNLHLFTPYPMEDSRRELGLALDERLVLFPWNPARAVKRFDIVQEAVEIAQQSDARIRLVPVYDEPHAVVAKYMSACDVMVLASDHEGSPMAVREAMACNLPVVSVDVGDVRQIIGDTQGCYLCRREPLDIAAKLGLALQHGHRTCGARVVRKKDAGWCADQIMLVYRSVLKKGSLQRKNQGAM